MRALEDVDADQVAIWVFSGGGLLIGDWLADSPDWLRCLALTYPVLNPAAVDALRPGRPLVLTKAGLERPEFLAEVDRFETIAAERGVAVEVVDVPDGHHGFECLDYTEQSRAAVRDALDRVLGNLTRSGRSPSDS